MNKFEVYERHIEDSCWHWHKIDRFQRVSSSGLDTTYLDYKFQKKRGRVWWHSPFLWQIVAAPWAEGSHANAHHFEMCAHHLLGVRICASRFGSGSRTTSGAINMCSRNVCKQSKYILVKLYFHIRSEVCFRKSVDTKRCKRVTYRKEWFPLISNPMYGFCCFIGQRLFLKRICYGSRYLVKTGVMRASKGHGTRCKISYMGRNGCYYFLYILP